MGNLLDSASIVLTPTAYDDGSMLSVKPNDGAGDFDFSRNSAATRVNAQGLVENVQILSGDLVSNGDFSQEGVQEVSNGSFSQEGAEQVTNGDFATDTNWSTPTGWSINNGTLQGTNVAAVSATQGGYSFLNKSFRVEYTITEISQGDVKIYLGGIQNTPQRSAVGTYVEYINITSGNSTLYIQGINNFTGKIDNVSVKEVGQDWTLGTGISIGSNEAIFTSVASGQQLAQLSLSGVVGKTYKISYEIKSITSGAFSASIGTTLSDNQNSSVGVYTEYLTATTTAAFYIRSRGTTSGSVTNISVKEVAQDWSLNAVDFSLGSVFFNNANDNIFQNKPFTVGKKYRFSFSGSGNLSYRTGYAGADGTKKPITLPHTVDIVATSDTNRIQPYGAIDGSQGTLTSVVVKEVTDDTNLPRINYEGFSYQDVLGSELLTNGDFATNINGWGGNTTKTWNDGTLVSVGVGAGNNTNIQVGSILTAGKTYRFTWEIVSTDANASFVYTSSEGQITNSYVGAGTFTEDVTIVSNSTYVDFRFTGANTTTVFNSVSVKEVLGQEVVPDSGCGSWLLEPQSTNLFPYSEAGANWDTQTGTVVNDISKIAPDGVLGNVLKFTPSVLNGSLAGAASNTNNRTYPDEIVFTNSIVTNSIYLKSTNTNNFNASIKVVNKASDTEISAKTVLVTDKWQRFEVTGTVNGSQNGCRFVIKSEQAVYIWGVQVEQQSYATSYIPTTGAAATRLQDIANNSGNASLINSTEGVLYAEISTNTDGTDKTLSINNSITGGSNSRLWMGYSTTAKRVYALGYVNNSLQFVLSKLMTDESVFVKIACKYALNDVSFFVNGEKVGTDTSALEFIGLNSLDFSIGTGAVNSAPFYGKVKAVAVYKEALTDEQLTCLTTI